jgi:hypothetical protein
LSEYLAVTAIRKPLRRIGDSRAAGVEADPGAVSRVSPAGFTGRGKELAILRAAAAGRVRIVLIDGNAGIGKSRLVASACTQGLAGGNGRCGRRLRSG